MKVRASLLSLLVAAATVFSVPVSAQTDQQTTQASPDQSSPSSQDQNTDSSQTDTGNKTKSKVKKGSKNDVEAIGDRKMGGMDFYSIEKEIAMGRQYAEQFERTVKILKDPSVNEYVNRVGQNLVRNSDAKVPFTIKVVEDDSINAMAIPGGFFYVNTGLILAADGESEMAGAMAHEIAHVAARHATRGASRAQLANIMSIPLIFVGGVGGLAAQQAMGVGLPMTFLKFSRAFEAEADYLGIQYMYKAGYDPNGMIEMFEKLEAIEKKKPGSMAKIFTDHPLTPDRIAKSQEEIATILPARDQYIVTTSEFQDMKARLARIERHGKIDDNKDDKPVLRHTAGDQPPTEGSSSKDDDRPVLRKKPGN